nr:hypothetical protein [uncultured Desulfobacter sp.]
MNQLRPMVRIKSATDPPDFKSPSRYANGSILEYVLIVTTKKTDEKANHMGGFILIMGLKSRQVNEPAGAFFKTKGRVQFET